jgi:hypothetical protein
MLFFEPCVRFSVDFPLCTLCDSDSDFEFPSAVSRLANAGVRQNDAVVAASTQKDGRWEKHELFNNSSNGRNNASRVPQKIQRSRRRGSRNGWLGPARLYCRE